MSYPDNPCSDESYYRLNKRECDDFAEQMAREEASALNEVNIADIDPIKRITQNKMFPILLLGGLAIGALLYFKVIKI